MAMLVEQAQVSTTEGLFETETAAQVAGAVATSEACGCVDESREQSGAAESTLVPDCVAPAEGEEVLVKSCAHDGKPAAQGSEEVAPKEVDVTSQGSCKNNDGLYGQPEASQDAHGEAAAQEQGLSKQTAGCEEDGHTASQMVGEVVTAANTEDESVLDPNPPKQSTRSGSTMCEHDGQKTAGVEEKLGAATEDVRMDPERAAQMGTEGKPAVVGSMESDEFSHAEVPLEATEASKSIVTEMADVKRTNFADADTTNELPELPRNTEAGPGDTALDGSVSMVSLNAGASGGDQVGAVQGEGAAEEPLASQAKATEMPSQQAIDAPMEYIKTAGVAPPIFLEDREQREKAKSMLQAAGTPEPSEDTVTKWLETKWSMLTDRERRAKNANRKSKQQAAANRKSKQQAAASGEQPPHATAGRGRGRPRGSGRGRGKRPAPAAAGVKRCKSQTGAQTMPAEAPEDREAVTPVRAPRKQSSSPSSTTKRRRVSGGPAPSTIAESKSVPAAPVPAGAPPAPAPAPAPPTQPPAAPKAAPQPAQVAVKREPARVVVKREPGYESQSRPGRGGGRGGAGRGRGRRAVPYDEPAGSGIFLDEEVLRKARRCGMEKELRLLANNAAIVAKGLSGASIMDALRKSKGLVHPARAALLD